MEGFFDKLFQHVATQAGVVELILLGAIYWLIKELARERKERVEERTALRELYERRGATLETLARAIADLKLMLTVMHNGGAQRDYRSDD